MLQVVLWVSIILLAFRFLKGLKNLKASASSVAEPKHVGILRYFPSHSTMRSMSLPPTVYFGQIYNGLAALYPNEKLLTWSFAYTKFVLLMKHQSIEEFMNLGVPQTKPFQDVLRVWFGKGLFISSGPEWKSRRKIWSPGFYHNMLKELVPVFDKQSKVLVNILKSRLHEKWIDIEDPITLCSADIMGETVLGIRLATQQGNESKFLDAMKRATRTLAEFFFNPFFHFDLLFRMSNAGRQYKRDARYLQEFVLQAIRRKKEARKMQRDGNEKFSEAHTSKKSSILDYLMDGLPNHPEFTEEDLKTEMAGLIFAGQDTTACGMTWALYLIGLHPEIQTKIHEELDNIFENDHDRSVTADDLKEMLYLECVVKESLRLFPPGPFNLREVLEDFLLCGYTIKKGTIMLFSPYQIHRNAEVFPDPERFDPNRFLPENCVDRSSFAYIPFSCGPRTCMGRHFALMEEKTVIANVLRKFSLKSMEQRDKIFEDAGLMLRSVRPLKVQFTPRNAFTNITENKM